ncbi:TPA: hypothetical protein ACU1SE_001480 [Staphylococcus aureus]
MNEEKVKVVQQVLGQVEQEISFALGTDEGSQIKKKIEHNGREYEIYMTREECLEDTRMGSCRFYRCGLPGFQT